MDYPFPKHGVDPIRRFTYLCPQYLLFQENHCLRMDGVVFFLFTFSFSSDITCVTSTALAFSLFNFEIVSLKHVA